jgi:citrate lyase beta subunit
MLETTLGIDGRIGIELMVETPRALVDETGRMALPALVEAAGGRCVAAHLGAYDLTASLGVTAGEQRLDHPACDAARLLMQLALAGTGVDVVDGATTVLPIARHRETPHAPLSDAQRAINAGDVQTAWALHATAVRRALELGIYQGWDLHPAQLPARYGAVYAFFLAERTAMAARLRGFVAKATQAMRSGQIFDDAATGQGLLNFFVRGFACGALGEDDLRATGLSLDELHARSFARIVAARSGG